MLFEAPALAPIPSLRPLDRRRFLQILLAAGGSLLLARPASARQRTVLRIGAVISAGGGARAESAARGIELGIEEAARTGQLMGYTVELRRLANPPSAATLRAEGLAAVLGGFDLEGCVSLSGAARSAGILMLNIGCDADALRTPACGRRTFHVEASAAMKRAALRAGGAHAEGAARTELWSPQLEKFGAAQLNDRFRARFGHGMDGPAWTGWVAVKILSETAFRAATSRPQQIAAQLASAAARFDGHKGWPLFFRPGDQQLRQPLYLVDSSGRVVGERPERAAEGEATAGELLDRLAGPDRAGPCTTTSRGH